MLLQTLYNSASTIANFFSNCLKLTFMIWILFQMTVPFVNGKPEGWEFEPWTTALSLESDYLFIQKFWWLVNDVWLESSLLRITHIDCFIIFWIWTVSGKISEIEEDFFSRGQPVLFMLVQAASPFFNAHLRALKCLRVQLLIPFKVLHISMYIYLHLDFGRFYGYY